VASGFLLILPFPSHDVEFLAWIALIPLFLAIRGKTPLASYLLTTFTGLIFFVGIFYWIKSMGVWNWIEFELAIGFLAITLGIFGAGIAVMSRCRFAPLIVTAPALWVTVEYLRGHAGFLSLPWGLLGHSQYLNVPILQIASWGGVFAVSFLIVMVNACLAEFVQTFITHYVEKPVEKPIVMGLAFNALAVIVVVGTCLYYGLSIDSAPAPSEAIRLSVIQGNIPQDAKWKPELKGQHLAKHIGLTREVMTKDHPDLVVWPELSVQGRLHRDVGLNRAMTGLSKEIQTHLLIGTSQSGKSGGMPLSRKDYNSAVLLTPRGMIGGQYDKIVLLPFAEYLPHSDLIAWPSRYVAQDDTIPGNSYTILTLGGHRFAALICWETIFPEHVRQFVVNGAEFLVNMTNEAWFGDTAAPYQFLSMNVLRAAENRIAIARAANTGVSAVIGPSGRILGKVSSGPRDTFVDGFLTVDVPTRKELTFYSEHGDVFVWLCMLASGVFLTYCLTLGKPGSA
jgi:apolipoprotein N-acyltransferase